MARTSLYPRPYASSTLSGARSSYVGKERNVNDNEDFFGPYEEEFKEKPLEKRHHPECPSKRSPGYCKCRELYDADYSDGFEMPQR